MLFFRLPLQLSPAGLSYHAGPTQWEASKRIKHNQVNNKSCIQLSWTRLATTHYDRVTINIVCAPVLAKHSRARMQAYMWLLGTEVLAPNLRPARRPHQPRTTGNPLSNARTFGSPIGLGPGPPSLHTFEPL